MAQHIAMQTLYNMYRRAMAILLQHDVRFILLDELPAPTYSALAAITEIA